MKYCSTRNSGAEVSSAQAIARGLAPDGGLYVPVSIPRLSLSDLEKLCGMDYRARAAFIMKLFLDDYTQDELSHYASLAYGDNYSHPDIAPVTILPDKTAVLELWHGPTCAFKDMALQMLPHLLSAALRKTGENRRVCVVVATSGDTGKAALEGFSDVPGTKIAVFYPKDGVSNAQKLQMITQTGENVFVCAVKGNFDDAQTGVKTVFGDEDFARELDSRGYFLSSANSINWGRLLPQIVYYVSACCDLIGKGMTVKDEKINFCVPTGNFGNILAGWYAREMGAPVGRLICASNQNNILTDFIETGVYDINRDFYNTKSPSMDILVSSNLERLLYNLSGDDRLITGFMRDLASSGSYKVGPELLDGIRKVFSAGFCGEDETEEQIKKTFFEQRYLIDTHTAVGTRVCAEYIKKTGDCSTMVIVSTASPFKFCESVLSALGERPEKDREFETLEKVSGQPVPAPLKGLKEREVRFGYCVEKNELMRAVDGFLA